MCVIGALYARFGDVDALRRILTGLAAAAAGMLIATVVKMAVPLCRSIGSAPIVMAATAGAIGLMHWPLLWVMIVLVPLRIAATAWVRPMKADGGILGTLALQFVVMALLAFGGATAVVPEIHRLAVELHGWMSERQFADMYAISQTLPGPNVMLVTLIGFHVAGFWGALVATLAMCGPRRVAGA